MSASPWTNGNNTENRKRASTMRKTIKNREGPDEYVSELEEKGNLDVILPMSKLKCKVSVPSISKENKVNKFLKDISKIIDSKDGVFLLENTDLLSIIKYNLFRSLKFFIRRITKTT
jgi:hypothetical protein